MLAANNHFSAALAMDEEAAMHMPLVGTMTMHYLRATSEEEGKPVILTISISPLLGGRRVDLPLELNFSNMPDSIDMKYVKEIIDSKMILHTFLDELRSENVDQANIKVCLSFEGIPSHREKINGFEVLSLKK